MHIAYLSIAIVVASVVTFSAIAKLRHDPKVVHVIKDVVGVPMKYFPLLAACEFAGALGLIAGIWLPWAGLADWRWPRHLFCRRRRVASACK